MELKCRIDANKQYSSFGTFVYVGAIIKLAKVTSNFIHEQLMRNMRKKRFFFAISKGYILFGFFDMYKANSFLEWNKRGSSPFFLVSSKWKMLMFKPRIA